MTKGKDASSPKGGDAKLAVKKHERKEAPPSPSRWFSLEFIITYILFTPGYVYMFWWAITQSNEYNNGNRKVEGVEPGWFMGRKMDLSDSQWNTLRTNFPLLLGGMVLFLSLSEIAKRTGSGFRRIAFYNVASFAFLIVLHGLSAVWVVLIALLNYLIPRMLGKSRVLPFVVWGFNAGVLWTSYFSHGYRFQNVLGEGYAWMDEHRGLIAWEGYFKISMLRFISYGMDYYWMNTARTVGVNKVREPYFTAQEQHLPRAHYDWWHYFAYIFYVPLYIAGPISSFNAWAYQVYNGPQSTTMDADAVSRPRVWKEIIRLAVIFIGFEIYLHYIYLYAINEHGIWKQYASVSVCIIAYFVLNFMYLKFLIIWRFFRVVSMFDGIDVPENMNRCVNNNFTFTGFWRSWHASFNKWTVRYLYIPLGGRSTQTMSIWLIFLFIGLWHDLWISWVAWALLNCLFFSIEILIIVFFSRPQMDWLTTKPYWRHIVALAGALNVFLLMLANLAILHGFTNSMLFLERAFLEGSPVKTFMMSWLEVSFPVLWMLEIREGEKRSNSVKRF